MILPFSCRVVSLVPFAVLSLCNISIIVTLLAAQYRRRSQLSVHNDNSPRMTSMTAILVLVSVMFFLLTAPMAIWRGIRDNWNPNQCSDPAANCDSRMMEADWNLAWAVVNMLVYANHAINFFLYLISGRKFRNQLKQLLGCSRQAEGTAKATTSNSVKATETSAI